MIETIGLFMNAVTTAEVMGVMLDRAKAKQEDRLVRTFYSLFSAFVKRKLISAALLFIS
jgi:hypothetical protein